MKVSTREEIVAAYNKGQRSFLVESSDGLDLSKLDLPRVSFKGSNLTNANLSRSSFTASDFSRVDLSGANCNQTDLTEANLNNAVLKGANLRHTILWGAKLQGVNAPKVDFTTVVGGLERVSFSNANLNGADFAKVQAPNTVWTAANLQSVNFYSANLERAMFTEADLSYASFYGADLSGAFFNDVQKMSWADFRRANLEKSNFIGADMRNVRFDDFTYLKGVCGVTYAYGMGNNNRVVIGHLHPDHDEICFTSGCFTGNYQESLNKVAEKYPDRLHASIRDQYYRELNRMYEELLVMYPHIEDTRSHL